MRKLGLSLFLRRQQPSLRVIAYIIRLLNLHLPKHIFNLCLNSHTQTIALCTVSPAVPHSQYFTVNHEHQPHDSVSVWRRFLPRCIPPAFGSLHLPLS